MIELTESELLERITEEKRLFVFIYTPFCGTCGVARRMLEVLEQMRPNMPLAAANILYMPRLTEQWQITSVPCLLKLEDGVPINRLYAMQAIDHVFRFMEPDPG
ncbi:thioredoxin family protein [Paenibacillus koleovorans]|uniref:thioredoxin family protein n=1 Tax=Paenibacillus koleovorans TaxID=121608 RepID=UPI000FD6D2EA|nr:thioredoxin family protein [Paenibacillus koleovorans]